MDSCMRRHVWTLQLQRCTWDSDADELLRILPRFCRTALLHGLIKS